MADALHKGHRLAGVSLSVADNETLVVLGPSGAGKTSLLRVIAGLEKADAGTLQLDGCDLLHVAPQRRRVAVVFQDDSLFPHMTLYDNLSFALRVRRAPAARIDGRVREIAAALDIAAHLDARPGRLSGGERQRAALARAVLSEPRVLLLDEPLAHLDPQLRAQLRRRFNAFRSAFRGAAIHVTHDHVEALSIGDRLAIMMQGRIVQCGAPQEVYDRPASVQIARFFGSPPMNLLEHESEILGIRPERVRIDDTGSLHGVVTGSESTGADVFVRVRTERGDLLARAPASEPLPAPGARTAVAFDARYVRKFDRRTGTALS